MKCNCLEPVLILNPQLNQGVSRFDKICIDGRMSTINSQQRYSVLSGEPVAKTLNIPYAHRLSATFMNKLNADEKKSVQNRLDKFVEDSFFLNSDTQEVMPIYQWVPCGKCKVCQARHLSSYAQRCLFALQESLRPAYFVTFTFNDSHLPSDKMDKSYIQKFKKRFSKNIQSLTGFDAKIRYFVVSENGKNTHRLHYHAIIFGIPYLTKSDKPYLCDVEHDYLVRKMVEYCWREPVRKPHSIFFQSFDEFCKEFPNCVYSENAQCDPHSFGFCDVKSVSRSSTAVKYVLKYAFKNKFGDDDKDPDLFNWRSCSVNLGVDFAKSYRDIILKSSDGSFQFKDFLSGQLVTVNLSSYYISKLFPSNSKLVPIELRRAIYNVYHTTEFVMSQQAFSKETKGLFCMCMGYLREYFPFAELLSIRCDKKWFTGMLNDYNRNDFREQYENALLAQLFSDINIISTYEFVYADILKQVSDRCTYFSKKCRSGDLTYGQLLDIADKFEKELIEYQNKEIF